MIKHLNGQPMVQIPKADNKPSTPSRFSGIMATQPGAFDKDVDIKENERFAVVHPPTPWSKTVNKYFDEEKIMNTPGYTDISRDKDGNINGYKYSDPRPMQEFHEEFRKSARNQRILNRCWVGLGVAVVLLIIFAGVAT